MASKGNNLVLTRDIGRLTPDQRSFYESNGYLVLPRFIPENILKECDQRFDDIISGVVDRQGIVVMRDVSDRKSVNKIQDINQDEVFRKYIEYKPMLDLLEAFTGPNIVAVHNMLIAKPPDSGSNSSRHPPHQDLYYFPFRPINKIVAAWTAMEPCDVMNGCLFVSPGSHLSEKLHAHGYPEGAINKLYHGIQNLPEDMEFKNLEMKPGDTVFFHPLLIHGSGVNRSTRTRKAISCHYAAAECSYIDVAGTVQDLAAKELVESVRKRLRNESLELHDYWRLKTTIVRGIRSSL